MDLSALIPTFGNFLYTVVAFVVALSIIVAVHELGHYLVGRWTGIAAEVFSLGFGPVLFSRVDRHGTRWQVAAIPLGGFVKFLGDADAASGKDSEAVARMDPAMRRKTVHAAPLWARSATVAAGPVFNFILAIVVFAGVFAWQGVAREPMTIAEVSAMPATSSLGPGLRTGDVVVSVAGSPTPASGEWDGFFETLPQTPTLDYGILRDGARMTVTAPHIFPALVGGVAADSAAGDVGLARGDVILSIDGRTISTFAELRELAGASEGRPLLLSVWRDGQTLDFTLVPRSVDLPTSGGGFETRWLIGVTGSLLFQPETELPGAFQSLSYGVGQTWEIMQSSVSGLYHMAVGAISSCNLRGPIGIAQTSGDAAAQGGLTFIYFIAVLSAAVGLLNLFPIPILDGGHLVFHAWEAIAGRAPGDRAVRVMMSIGLVLLALLMAFALTNDLRC